MPRCDTRPGANEPRRPRAQDVDRHVAARLRERRRALGLTQQRLAERVGTTYQQIHKYETGANRISAGWLPAFARALGVEPGHFFAGLGAGGPPWPTAEQQQLELAGNFATLPRWQQEALLELVRALAGTDAGPEQEGTSVDGTA